jgi:hypothetical protein
MMKPDEVEKFIESSGDQIATKIHERCGCYGFGLGRLLKS